MINTLNLEVLTNIGKKKISDLKINDLVLSYNEITKECEYSKVINKIEKEIEEVYEITINNKIITISNTHPFYNGKEYIKISNLKEKDKILGLDNKYYGIEKIEKIEETNKEINITVEKNHNYFIEEGYLVHNYGSHPSNGSGTRSYWSGGGGGGGSSADAAAAEEARRRAAKIKANEEKIAKNTAEINAIDAVLTAANTVREGINNPSINKTLRELNVDINFDNINLSLLDANSLNDRKSQLESDNRRLAAENLSLGHSTVVNSSKVNITLYGKQGISASGGIVEFDFNNAEDAREAAAKLISDANNFDALLGEYYGKYGKGSRGIRNASEFADNLFKLIDTAIDENYKNELALQSESKQFDNDLARTMKRKQEEQQSAEKTEAETIASLEGKWTGGIYGGYLSYLLQVKCGNVKSSNSEKQSEFQSKAAKLYNDFRSGKISEKELIAKTQTLSNSYASNSYSNRNAALTDVNGRYSDLFIDMIKQSTPGISDEEAKKLFENNKEYYADLLYNAGISSAVAGINILPSFENAMVIAQRQYMLDNKEDYGAWIQNAFDVNKLSQYSTLTNNLSDAQLLQLAKFYGWGDEFETQLKELARSSELNFGQKQYKDIYTKYLMNEISEEEFRTGVGYLLVYYDESRKNDYLDVKLGYHLDDNGNRVYSNAREVILELLDSNLLTAGTHTKSELETILGRNNVAEAWFQSRLENINNPEYTGGDIAAYIADTLIPEYRNAWFSSEIGNQRLFEKFYRGDATDVSIRQQNTDYINFAMQNGHEEWILRKDLTNFADQLVLVNEVDPAKNIERINIEVPSIYKDSEIRTSQYIQNQLQSLQENIGNVALFHDKDGYYIIHDKDGSSQNSDYDTALLYGLDLKFNTSFSKSLAAKVNYELAKYEFTHDVTYDEIDKWKRVYTDNTTTYTIGNDVYTREQAFNILNGYQPDGSELGVIKGTITDWDKYKAAKRELETTYNLVPYYDKLSGGTDLQNLTNYYNEATTSKDLNWKQIYTELNSAISEINTLSTKELGKPKYETARMVKETLGLEDGEKITLTEAIDRLFFKTNDSGRIINDDSLDFLKLIADNYDINKMYANSDIVDDVAITGMSIAKGWLGGIEGIKDFITVTSHSDFTLDHSTGSKLVDSIIGLAGQVKEIVAPKGEAEWEKYFGTADYKKEISLIKSDKNSLKSYMERYYNTLSEEERQIALNTWYDPNFDYTQYSDAKLRSYMTDKYYDYIASTDEEREKNFTKTDLFYLRMIENNFNPGMITANIDSAVQMAIKEKFFQQSGYIQMESLDRYKQALIDYVSGNDFSSNYKKLIDDLDFCNRVLEQKEAKFQVMESETESWWNNWKENHAREYNYAAIQEGDFLFTAGEQIGRMGPMILANATAAALAHVPVLAPATGLITKIGETIGTVSLWTSAYGDAAATAFSSGASYKDAMNYAALSAEMEVLSEKMFVKNFGFGGYQPNWLEDLLTNGLTKGATRVFGSSIADSFIFNAAVKLAVAGFGESAEEIITDFANPFFEYATYKNNQEFSQVWHENVSLRKEIETALISAFTGVIFSGAGYGTSSIYERIGLKNNIAELQRIAGAHSTLMEENVGRLIKATLAAGEVSMQEKMKIIDEEMAKIVDELSTNPEAIEMIEEYRKFKEAYATKTVEATIDGATVTIPVSLVNDIRQSLGLTNAQITIIDGKVEFRNDPTIRIALGKNNVLVDSGNYGSKLLAALNSQTEGILQSIEVLSNNPLIANDPIDAERISEISGLLSEISSLRILTPEQELNVKKQLELLKKNPEVTSEITNQINELEKIIMDSEHAKTNLDYTTLVKATELYEDLQQKINEAINTTITLSEHLVVNEINKDVNSKYHEYEITYMNDQGFTEKYIFRTSNNLQLDLNYFGNENLSSLIMDIVKNNKTNLEFAIDNNGKLIVKESYSLITTRMGELVSQIEEIQNQINSSNNVFVDENNELKTKLQNLISEKENLSNTITDLMKNNSNFAEELAAKTKVMKSQVMQIINKYLILNPNLKTDSVLAAKIDELKLLLDEINVDEILTSSEEKYNRDKIKNLKKAKKAKRNNARIAELESELEKSENAKTNAATYYDKLYQANKIINEIQKGITKSVVDTIKLSDKISLNKVNNVSQNYNTYEVVYNNEDGTTLKYTFNTSNNIYFNIALLNSESFVKAIEEIVKNNNRYVDIAIDTNGNVITSESYSLLTARIYEIGEEIAKINKNEEVENNNSKERIQELTKERE